MEGRRERKNEAGWEERGKHGRINERMNGRDDMDGMGWTDGKTHGWMELIKSTSYN